VCEKFLPTYSGTKIIIVNRDFAQLSSQTYRHFFCVKVCIKLNVTICSVLQYDIGCLKTLIRSRSTSFYVAF